MKYRKLDEQDDMTFGHGLDDFHIDSPEAVAQSVLTRLRMWKKEWYIDLADGTPYYEEVLGKNKQNTAVQAIYKRIRDTQGVKEIKNFSTTYDPDTRQTLFEIELDTDFGQVTVNG